MKLSLVHIALITLPACSSSLMAQTMQCPHGIVDSDERDGIYQPEIRQKCGTPNVERPTLWRYQRESFIYTLSFEDDGELISIEQEPVEEEREQ